jgi:hypothetical protein
MKPDATLPQLVALGGLSLLALVIGLLAPANWINMRLSARDVGGVIMPPGMIMDRNTSADAMRDMATIDPRRVAASYGLGVRGDNLVPYRMEGNVKVFELRTSVIRWTILPGVTVDAYAYNNQIPGPRIHIRQGDRVRVKRHQRAARGHDGALARDHSAKPDGWSSRNHPTGNPAQCELQLRVHSRAARHLFLSSAILTGRRRLVFTEP